MECVNHIIRYMSLNGWQIYLAEELEEYVSFRGSGDNKPSSMLLSRRQSIQ